MRGGLRIVGGSLRGRRLLAGWEVRPTSGRAREALFSILAREIPGCHFLELYAGSGAVGLEALSRGAASVTLVDARPEWLYRNRERLRSEAAAVRILGLDVRSALAVFRGEGKCFDIVFADPPYAEAMPTEATRDLPAVVAERGCFILQTDIADRPTAPEGFRTERVAYYSRNVFHFFRRVVDRSEGLC